MRQGAWSKHMLSRWHYFCQPVAPLTTRMMNAASLATRSNRFAENDLKHETLYSLQKKKKRASTRCVYHHPAQEHSKATSPSDYMLQQWQEKLLRTSGRSRAGCANDPQVGPAQAALRLRWPQLDRQLKQCFASLERCLDLIVSKASTGPSEKPTILAL